MADVLIRGMEMPTNRDVTIRIDPNGEVYVYDTYPTLLLRAVTLPEGHGRLIDVDALDRAFTDLRFNSDGTLNHWGDRPGWCMHGYEVEKLIADAPTIVPAEGGTDNGF